MQKQAWTWTTPRLTEPARLARWGHFGAPVLIFPTAGGDFEEIERFHLISALGELIERGRMKAYSVDGLWMRAYLSAKGSGADCEPVRKAYDSYLYEDVLPRIRADCQDPRIEPILAGASRGACMAIGTLLRHPEVFRVAIAVSLIDDSTTGCSTDFGPHGAVPETQARLEKLRQRSFVLGTGEGDYERPADSRRLSEALAAKGIPCRLSLWGVSRQHTWATWRDVLPRLLAEQL